MSETVIAVRNLRKTYGPVTAVESISFDVYKGEIFGMVGPNGAGKTTAIECIEGLRYPDSGSVVIGGLDPYRDGYTLRQRVGMQLQEAGLYDRIKVWEALDLFASFYRHPASTQALIENVGLTDKKDSYFSHLSGGQKRRLLIALALINNPELVFFDELTTGLDPQARAAMWQIVRDIGEQGKTVFLTTHLMDEAEGLCDRVAIMDHGTIIALDTPSKLIERFGPEERLIFSVEGKFDENRLLSLSEVTRVERHGEEITAFGRGVNLLTSIVNFVSAEGFRFRNLRREPPNLENVFLTLTGRRLRD